MNNRDRSKLIEFYKYLMMRQVYILCDKKKNVKFVKKMLRLNGVGEKRIKRLMR